MRVRSRITYHASLINLEHGQKGFLRDFDFADALHALLAFLLLFEQLALPRDVAAIAFREHVLPECLDAFARDDAAPDGRLVVLAPPPIQGIGNAGGFQMQLELLGGSFDFQKLDKVSSQLIKEAAGDSQLQHVLTTFSPGAPPVTYTIKFVAPDGNACGQATYTGPFHDPFVVFCLPPLENVVKNTLDDPDNKVVEGKGNYGFNAQTHAYGDLVEMGVVDPTRRGSR